MNIGLILIGRQHYQPTVNTQPSLTDQSQADETNVNVIVKRYAVSGTVPGPNQNPLYGDFTVLPRDLREFIHTAKDLATLKDKLPAALQQLTYEQLATMDYAALGAILKPPAPPQAPPPATPPA